MGYCELKVNLGQLYKKDSSARGEWSTIGVRGFKGHHAVMLVRKELLVLWVKAVGMAFIVGFQSDSGQCEPVVVEGTQEGYGDDGASGYKGLPARGYKIIIFWKSWWIQRYRK